MSLCTTLTSLCTFFAYLCAPLLPYTYNSLFIPLLRLYAYLFLSFIVFYSGLRIKRT